MSNLNSQQFQRLYSEQERADMSHARAKKAQVDAAVQRILDPNHTYGGTSPITEDPAEEWKVTRWEDDQHQAALEGDEHW